MHWRRANTIQRHNAALKIFVFQMFHDLDLMDSVGTAFVPVYADRVMVRANRIDARVVDGMKKVIKIIEMGCPWVDNRFVNDLEKTEKYEPTPLKA